MNLVCPLRIGLVAGSAVEHQALHCGVRDYTERLAEALGETGMDARLLEPADWGLKEGVAFGRRLRSERLDVLHIQYPCIGHRRSLWPHVLGLVSAARACVVTLHEHSALPRIQQATNRLFRASADRLVFTTAYEATAFGASRASRLIPIGSNVPVHPHARVRDNSVLYFGQIRPGKGIEAFLQLAARASGEADFGPFQVIGSAPPRWAGYARELQEGAPGNVTWRRDLPLPAVAEAMGVAMAAYLPFPDGAGLRRGSLMAALANGLPVLAPLGAATTGALRAAILPAATPEAALMQLRALRHDPQRGASVAAAGAALVRRFDWAAIADAHVALYREALIRDVPAVDSPRRVVAGEMRGGSTARAGLAHGAAEQ